MSHKPNTTAIATGLMIAVVFWGANNVGTKWLVGTWPPLWTGSVRFFLAGVILLCVLRISSRRGPIQALNRKLAGQLFLRCGLGLALYVLFYCWSLKLIPVSHVALYLGASPVWALLIEERPRWNLGSLRRYSAALVAVSGVVLLFWTAIGSNDGYSVAGEVMGLFCSFCWTNYSHQVRILSRDLRGAEVAAHSMWMAGAILLPLGVAEVFSAGSMVIDGLHVVVQGFCIIFGGVIPYTLWNRALRRWQASRVMLFNNFIPITTTLWAFLILGEPLTPVFFVAMLFVITGVLLGQAEWFKLFKQPEVASPKPVSQD